MIAQPPEPLVSGLMAAPMRFSSAHFW